MTHAYTGRRRYVFAIHGWSDWQRRRFRRRRAPRQRDEPRGIPTLQSLRLADVAHHERLLEAFDELRREGGPAPGVDGRTFSDYSRSEIASVLRGTWRAIREGTYRPQPARRVSIPKPDGGRRILRVRTVVDRTVGKALARALTPLFDPLFSDTSFGFRPGRSHLQMLAALEARMLASDCWVLAIDDIRRAFDNVRLPISVFARVIGDPALVNLIDVVLRGHQGRRRTRGIDQGCSFSPLTLNVFLDEILDRPLMSDGDPLLYRCTRYRYADNLVFLSRGVPDGLRALRRARQLLQAQGLELKGQDGPPVNLANSEGQASLLGFRISRGTNRLQFAIEPQSWNDLEDSLQEAHLSPRPAQTAQSVVRGWVLGSAPAIETDAEPQILRGIRFQIAKAGLSRETPDCFLRDVMEKVRGQWERLRSQCSQTLREWESDPLGIRCAPRAVGDPVVQGSATEAVASGMEFDHCSHPDATAPFYLGPTRICPAKIDAHLDMAPVPPDS
jgi:Reverse transcriptase (RNA-dependent DNA polymerase)